MLDNKRLGRADGQLVYVTTWEIEVTVYFNEAADNMRRAHRCTIGWDVTDDKKFDNIC